jgi:hypoxanthine phosphoribosyltransferase
VNSFNPLLVKTATLHYKPWSIYRPDYFAEEVEDWIVYPWEYKETIINISKKLSEYGTCIKKLKDKLIEIGFNKEQIDRYI